MSLSPGPDGLPQLTLLLVLQQPPDPGMPARLAALSAAMPDAELRIYGHGGPDRMAAPMRRLAALAPSAWVELATRARPPGLALMEAVGSCRSPWVLWLPGEPHPDEAVLAQGLWRNHRHRGLSGVPRQEPCLFRREALLALPRIPGMMALLPELFSTCHDGLNATRSPGLAARLRRAYVALACKMGLGRTGH